MLRFRDLHYVGHNVGTHFGKVRSGRGSLSPLCFSNKTNRLAGLATISNVPIKDYVETILAIIGSWEGSKFLSKIACKYIFDDKDEPQTEEISDMEDKTSEQKDENENE